MGLRCPDKEKGEEERTARDRAQPSGGLGRKPEKQVASRVPAFVSPDHCDMKPIAAHLHATEQTSFPPVLIHLPLHSAGLPTVSRYRAGRP